MNNDKKIAVLGLGYVGLPLAVEFGKQNVTIGFDKNPKRIVELQSGKDRTREVTKEELAAAARLRFSSDESALKDCNVYIVAVPTPIDTHKRPDLTPLISASRTVGKTLAAGDIVIYESTVYPGCTEEVCVPILEAESGMTYNKDFFCGYSPERINPGDKNHRFSDIKKVTSGSTPEIAETVDELYARVVTAGTFKASSIRVAEAAKVIENAQRDLNIAFVNELAIIFRKMGIDTLDVLEAAGTKWNFLPFKPGLVGGHCIGVDPYYLTHKAEELGYHPEIILAGRRLNDNMGKYAANEFIKLLIKKGHTILGARVLIMGFTFKENCPDIRNTRVIDVVRELESFGCNVEVFDPWVDPAEVAEEYGVTVHAETNGPYDGIIVSVSHDQFTKIDFKALKNNNAVIFDLKGILQREYADLRL